MKALLLLFYLYSSLSQETRLEVFVTCRTPEIFSDYRNFNFKQEIRAGSGGLHARIKSRTLSLRNLNHRVRPDRGFLAAQGPEVRRAFALVSGNALSVADYLGNISAFLRHRIAYSAADLAQDAEAVLARSSGHCIGFTHVAQALLSCVGIASRPVNGFYLRESGSRVEPVPHRWLEVELPGERRVFYDPQYQDFSSRYLVTSMGYSPERIERFAGIVVSKKKKIVDEKRGSGMEEQFGVRLEKLKKLAALGISPYPYRYEREQRFADIIAAHGGQGAEELERAAAPVSCAGRILAIRGMGKSAFMHLFDGEEKLQVYVRKDVVSERDFAVNGLLDIGDIIGVKGTVFKTRTGELSVLVQELTFLAKSFHPLPEKWHGLQDKELRFRQRYLDLIVNPEAKEIFRKRSRLIQAVRRFFHERGYIEVETPMMHPIPGGASARPFVTHHNALNIDLYLRVAPELYLKRLLVGGMEKVFEINRNFRNEGISLLHNPEFTMIEFYELYRDFNDYMELTEQLLSELGREMLGGGAIQWQERKIPLAPPFPRLKFMDAIAARSGLGREQLWDEAAVRGHIAAQFPGEPLPPTFGKMLELLFDFHVEKSLVEPTFVTHYPKAISPLSKASRGDARETERFELYVAGMEIANGFSELNDPLEQRRRFEEQVRDRERGDDEAQRIDLGFLQALEHGMAPAAGEGIGIDRLVMLFTGAASIKEVILFPLLRPRE